MSFLISDAVAETTQNAAGALPPPPQSTTQSLMSVLPMILLLVVFMYFMVIRPQSKRAKEHKNLLGNIQKGDEIVTTSGVLGKIEKLGEDFIVLNIADGVNINIQKGAIASIVPRGTIKNSQ